MEKIKIDTNADLITTHNFIYKGKRFPFNMNLMKCFSNYFNYNEYYLEGKTDIDLLEEFGGDAHLSEQSIQEFINFCQYKEIILNNDNVISLHKLSIKFDVPSLTKFTQKFIKKHKKQLAVDFLIGENQNGNKEGEEMISNNLLDYIDDDRLFSVELPVLYRIISKYFEYAEDDVGSKQPPELIEFLIKCLDHYGRNASILFEMVDPKYIEKTTIWKLLTEYGDEFDFQFIGHNWQLVIDDVISDMKKEHRETKTEMTKLNSEKEKMENEIMRLNTENDEMQSEIMQLNKKHKRVKSKVTKLNEENRKNETEKEEMQAQISQLNSEEKKMKNEILNLNSENAEIKKENDEMQSEIMQLNKKHKRMKSKVIRLNAENRKNETEKEEMQAKISQLNSEEKKLKNEILKLNSEKEKILKDKQQMQSTIVRQISENKEMKDENLKLKSMLQKISQVSETYDQINTQMNDTQMNNVQQQNEEINEDIILRNYKSTSFTVYASNLSIIFDENGFAIGETSVSDLEELFEPYGLSRKPNSITIETKIGQKGYPFQFAFIKFKTHKQAQKAISELNYEKFNGIPICLTIADNVIKNIISRNRGNLLIQNLNTNIEVSDLHELFSDFGEIISCKISYYPVTNFQRSKGKSRGYGYVQFLCLGDAIKAMNSLNQKVINNRRISIYQYDKFKKLDTKKTYFCCCVYNLPRDYTNKELKNLFQVYGDPCSCKIIYPGFGLCTMDSHENAVKAVNGLNGQIIRNRMILCKPELTMEDKRNDSIAQEKKWIDMVNKEEYKDRIVSISGNNNAYTDEQLELEFIKFGIIETAEIIYDDYGNNKGFALICFSKSEEASKCIKNYSGDSCDGICCNASLVNEHNLINVFYLTNSNIISQPVFITRYNILKKCINYKKYLQRLDDMSIDQVNSLAENDSLFNKFITIS